MIIKLFKVVRIISHQPHLAVLDDKEPSKSLLLARTLLYGHTGK